MQPLSTNPFHKAINKIKKIIADSAENKKYFKSVENFTRLQKLPFQDLVFMELTSMVHGLQYELIDFKDALIKGEGVSALASKSAYVQARKKISPLFYKDLNKSIIDIVSESFSNPRTYKNHRLYAVDGTWIYMPQTPACVDAFGSVKNQYDHVAVCMAKASFLCDVLNRWVINTELDKADTGEIKLLQNQLDVVPRDGILILDRAYASIALIHKLNQLNIKFVIRCKKSHSNTVKKFVANREIRDVIIKEKLTDRAITTLKKEVEDDPIAKAAINCHVKVSYRLVKVALPNGEEEILMTNIFDSDFKEEDFGYIYNKRWGVETAIDVFKNKLRVELFSGHLPEHVLQDYYAGVCRYNLAVLLRNQAQQQLDLIEKPMLPQKKIQYEQQINMALSVSLTNKLMKIAATQPDILARAVKTATQILVRFPEPIRPDRKFPRKFKSKKERGKEGYNTNYKLTG